MNDCGHRHSPATDELGNKVACCSMIDLAVGAKVFIGSQICERCESECPDKCTPIQPLQQDVRGHVAARAVLNIVKLPVSEDRLRIASGKGRDEWAAEASRWGFTDEEIFSARRQSVVLLQQKEQHQAGGNLQANDKKAKVFEAIRVKRYRQGRPCIHIGEQTTRNCSEGPIYKCAVHKACSYCLADMGHGARSCVFCDDYVENVMARPAVNLDLAICVTTCPVIRGEKIAGHRYTISKTLESILAAGWARDDVIIFAEPGSKVPSGWRVVHRETRQTPFWNLWKGMLQIAGERPDADGQFWIEDDTWLSVGLRDELNRRGGLPENCGMLQVFRMSGSHRHWKSADELCEGKRSDGYQCIKPRMHMWGANAIILSKPAITWLSGMKRVPKGLSDSPDVKLSQMLMDKFTLWCCNPSLAQTDSSVPSTANHNVTERMESDTFVPIIAVAARGQFIMEVDQAALKIHIVRPSDGWILHKIGDALASGPRLSASEQPDPNADCNLYVNYAMWDRFKEHPGVSVGYFTHRSKANGRVFDRIAMEMDWCIAMSSRTWKLLPKDKRSVISMAIDAAYRSDKPFVVGVCSSNASRKRLGWADALRKIPGVEVRVTGGKVADADMPAWYQGIDCLVVLSELEGGPLPVIEALSLRKPVIAPDVGWCWQYPVVRYETLDELVKWVSRWASPSATWGKCQEELRQFCVLATQRKRVGKAQVPGIPVASVSSEFEACAAAIRRLHPRRIMGVGRWNHDVTSALIEIAFEHRPEVEYVGMFPAKHAFPKLTGKYPGFSCSFLSLDTLQYPEADMVLLHGPIAGDLIQKIPSQNRFVFT